MKRPTFKAPPYLSRPQSRRGIVRAVVLAVLVHGILGIFLFAGIRWKTKPPEPVSAELFSPPPAVTVNPKTELPVLPEVKPTPKPEPKPEPHPEPTPQPEPKPARSLDHRPIAIQPERRCGLAHCAAMVFPDQPVRHPWQQQFAEPDPKPAGHSVRATQHHARQRGVRDVAV